MKKFDVMLIIFGILSIMFTISVDAYIAISAGNIVLSWFKSVLLMILFMMSGIKIYDDIDKMIKLAKEKNKMTKAIDEEIK